MKSLFWRIVGCLLLAGLLAGSQSLGAAANPGVTWDDPVRLSDPNIEAGQPALAVDLSGVVHVVWSQTERVTLRPVGEGDTIYHSSFDGENWSRPIDIIVAGEGLAAQFPEITVTPNGYLHLVYSTSGTISALMHTAVHVSQARDIYAWSRPSAVASPAQGQHTFVSDSRGYLYLAYADFYTKNINFLMSKDNGETWGREVEVSAGLQRPDEFGIYPRLAVSESGRIHLVWNVLPWPGRLAYYAHSDDEGQTWSEPWLFDSSANSAYRQGFGPIVPDIQTYGGNQVHILWDGAPTVERNHIYSLDDGDTWTQPTIVFPELSETGRAGWNEMAFDADGILHAVSIIGPLHASWDGLGWSASQDIAVRAYTGDGEMMRIKVGLGNQLHVTGKIAAGDFHLTLDTAEVQHGSHAGIKTFVHQFVSQLLCFQRFYGKLEGFPVCGQSKPGLGHGGRQHELGAYAGLIGSQVFRKRRIFEAADAAEEIDLPGRHPEIDAVFFSGVGAAAG